MIKGENLMKYWLIVRKDFNVEGLNTLTHHKATLYKQGEKEDIYQIETLNDVGISSEELKSLETVLEKLMIPRYSVDQKALYAGNEVRIISVEPIKTDSVWKVHYRVIDSKKNIYDVLDESLLELL